MVQPLPSPFVPNAGGMIDAYRTGHSDFLENQKRELFKKAGGLAAAGNMTGAQGELYKGGEFGEARNISQEIRASSSHAKALETHQLERALKGQELLARLAGSIQSPEQFEVAKARLKKLGLPVDSYTFDQLPQLRQQSLSVQEQLQGEYQKRKLDLLQQKIDAKASAPEKLTEGQAKARNFLNMAETGEGFISEEAKKRNIPVEQIESPMSTLDMMQYENMPSAIANKTMLDKHSKRYLQAAMTFIRAKLRKESGATISPEEFRQDFQTYFPQPGDDPQTRRQKAESRKQVMEGLKIEGGMRKDVQMAPPPNQTAAPQGGNLSGDPSQWTDEQFQQYLMSDGQ
jgi:hypothetical protein